MRRAISSVVACASLAVIQFSAAVRAHAQTPAPRSTFATDTSSTLRDVRGRVLLGSSSDEKGLSGQTVVLHRISSAGSGPVDSVTTRRDGSFRLTFHPTADVLYLLSVRYAGIGYFSSPLGEGEGTPADASADIVVFDTSSVARTAALRGRHVIVSAPDSAGQRAIVEVFELANDSSVTLISTQDASPVWRLHLPPGAAKPRVGEGEFAADAVRFTGNEVQLFAPLPPGLKQLVVSYELSPVSFPLAMPMERASTVLEVLLEEMTGHVEGARLKTQAPVTVGGRRFQRSLAQDVDSTAVISISLPPVIVSTSAGSLWIVTPVVLAIALGAWWFSSRRSHILAVAAPAIAVRSEGVIEAGPPIPKEEALAHRAATLDALLAQTAPLDAATRARYVAEREKVMEELRATLAAVAAQD